MYPLPVNKNRCAVGCIYRQVVWQGPTYVGLQDREHDRSGSDLAATKCDKESQHLATDAG